MIRSLVLLACAVGLELAVCGILAIIAHSLDPDEERIRRHRRERADISEALKRDRHTVN